MKNANTIYSEIKDKIGSQKFSSWLVYEKKMYYEKTGADANMQPQEFMKFLNKRYNMLNLQADGGSVWSKIQTGIDVIAGGANAYTQSRQTTDEPQGSRPAETPPPPPEEDKKPFFKRPAGIVVILTAITAITIFTVKLTKKNKGGK